MVLCSENPTASRLHHEEHVSAGGSKAVKDDPAAAAKASKKAAAEGDASEDKETYYDAIKKDMGGRVARTKAAMDALDPTLRVAMEGFRTGTYLRMRFTGAHLIPTKQLMLYDKYIQDTNDMYWYHSFMCTDQLGLRAQRHTLISSSNHNS